MTDEKVLTCYHCKGDIRPGEGRCCTGVLIHDDSAICEIYHADRRARDSEEYHQEQMKSLDVFYYQNTSTNSRKIAAAGSLADLEKCCVKNMDAKCARTLLRRLNDFAATKSLHKGSRNHVRMGNYAFLRLVQSGWDTEQLKKLSLPHYMKYRASEDAPTVGEIQSFHYGQLYAQKT